MASVLQDHLLLVFLYEISKERHCLISEKSKLKSLLPLDDISSAASSSPLIGKVWFNFPYELSACFIFFLIKQILHIHLDFNHPNPNSQIILSKYTIDIAALLYFTRNYKVLMVDHVIFV